MSFAGRTDNDRTSFNTKHQTQDNLKPYDKTENLKIPNQVLQRNATTSADRRMPAGCTQAGRPQIATQQSQTTIESDHCVD